MNAQLKIMVDLQSEQNEHIISVCEKSNDLFFNGKQLLIRKRCL